MGKEGKPKRDGQARKYILEFNNPTEHGVTDETIKEGIEALSGLIYACGGDHIGGQRGTPHKHVYLQTKSPYRWTTIKKLFPGATDIQAAKGTAQQSRVYIRKEGKHSERAAEYVKGSFWEIGECPLEQPGKRTDLLRLKEMIQEGMTVGQILDEEPKWFTRVRDIERWRHEAIFEEYRTKTRSVRCRYIYGLTRSGKTTGVIREYGIEKIHRVTDYEHPWDNYRGQKILVLDEFDSQLRMSVMLNVLEGHPQELPARYFNRHACWEEVVVISNKPIDQQYAQIRKESPDVWDAFEVRFASVECWRREEVHWAPTGEVCPF